MVVAATGRKQPTGAKESFVRDLDALTFINPTVAMGPVFYILSSLYNSWSIYQFEKGGMNPVLHCDGRRKRQDERGQVSAEQLGWDVTMPTIPPAGERVRWRTGSARRSDRARGLLRFTI